MKHKLIEFFKKKFIILWWLKFALPQRENWLRNFKTKNLDLTWSIRLNVKNDIRRKENQKKYMWSCMKIQFFSQVQSQKKQKNKNKKKPQDLEPNAALLSNQLNFIKKKNITTLVYIHTYIHNWSLQPFRQDYWPSFSHQ